MTDIKRTLHGMLHDLVCIDIDSRFALGIAADGMIEQSLPSHEHQTALLP